MIFLNTALAASPRYRQTEEPPVSSYEPETTAYMTAIDIPNDSTVYYAGTAQEITGSQAWTLFDSVVKYYKDNGEWTTNIYHWHPMFGTTAAQRGYNAKNIDTFYMTFYGSWIFNSLGNVGNGSNTYSAWNFISASEMAFDNSGMSIVSTEAGTNDAFDYGALNDLNNNTRMAISYNNTSYVYLGNAKSVANTNKTGMFTMTRLNGVVKAHRNGIEFLSTAGGGTGLATRESFYGAINNGSATLFGSKTYADAMHHSGGNPLVIQEGLRMWNEGLGRKTWA